MPVKGATVVGAGFLKNLSRCTLTVLTPSSAKRFSRAAVSVVFPEQVPPAMPIVYIFFYSFQSSELP